MSQTPQTTDPLYVSGRSKAYRHLIPLLIAVYFIAFIDRTNVGMAKTSLEADIGLSAAAYGLGAGIFFVSYALLELPSNLILHRVGARFWIGRIAVTWGIISSAMMFVWNDWSFYVMRFLLGAAEAGLYPGLLYIITIWFAQADRAKVVGLLLTAVGAAQIIGSPLGGALMLMDGLGGLHGWQWMFLIEGLPAIAIGIFIWLKLPNRPTEAKWLTPGEAEAMTLAAGSQGKEPRISGALRAGLSNPVVLLVAALYFLNQLSIYGVLYFVPSAIEAMNVSNPLMIGLLASSIGIGSAIGFAFVPRLLRGEGKELPLVALTLVGALLGGLVFVLSDTPGIGLAGMSFAALCAAGIQPLFWSVIMARVSGRMAAGVIGFVSTIGLTGGFVGPYLFGLVEEATSSASAGFWVFVAALAVSLFLLPALIVARRRTQRADMVAAATAAEQESSV